MNRKNWKYRSSTERRYAATLNQLTQQVELIAQRYSTLDGILGALSVLAVSPDWRKFAQAAAMRMVSAVAGENALTWREAAKQGGRAHEIHMLLKTEMRHSKAFNELIQTNAELITSMPSYVASGLTKHIASETIAGKRADALLQEIRAAAPRLTEARAKLIARTEVAKTQAAITQTRSQSLGLNFYHWETSSDQRVRSSHAHMQGVICSYLNPPSPEMLIDLPSVGCYNPGCIWNCRCFAATVVDLDFESFPARMVQGNSIITVSKAQFLALQ
jgi:SPP1 gp7 family putative phage head morphogenesis protein